MAQLVPFDILRLRFRNLRRTDEVQSLSAVATCHSHKIGTCQQRGDHVMQQLNDVVTCAPTAQQAFSLCTLC